MEDPGIAVNMQIIVTVLIVLFLFGCIYAWVVYRLGGRKNGYVSAFVAVGVTATLLGAAVIDWKAALLVLACFVASGIPMMAGEFITAMLDRDAAVKAERERAEETFRGMNGGDYGGGST